MGFQGIAFRVLGSAAVVSAGGFLGFGLAGRLEQELMEMNRFESGLLGLKAEISYSLLPLPKALIKCGERVGGIVGQVFLQVGEKTGMEHRKIPWEAFWESLNETDFGIPPHQLVLLEDLFKNLGTSGYKEQVAFIEALLEDAKSRRKLLEGEYRKKARVYRYLGVLGAACVVIILL